MPRWGEYETVRELATVGMGTIWTARRVPPGSAEERYIIKAIEGLSVLADRSRAEREIGVFLEAARAQKDIAERGAVGVARVHECGRTEDSAYFVGDLYPRSLATLIARGVGLSRWEVLHLAASVIDALREIQRVGGRGHGQLKAGNVLIGGRDGPSIVGDPVVLTDLRATSLLVDGGHAADMRALGSILYEAIIRRPLREKERPDLTITGEWSRLGATAATWSEICRRLLQNSPGERPPSLDEVRAMLPLGVENSNGGRTVLWVGAAALALGVGVGYWWSSEREAARTSGQGAAQSLADEPGERVLPVKQLAEEWPWIVNDWGYWFFARESIADKLERLARGSVERVPETLLQALRRGDLRSPAEIVGVPSSDREQQLRRSPSTWADDPLVDVQAAVGRIRDASRTRFAIAGLRAEIQAFAPASKLEQLRQQALQRGWSGAAERLRVAAEEIAAVVDPASPAGTVISPDVLTGALTVVACARTLEKELARLEELESVLVTSGDPVLASFPAMVAAHTSKSFRGETDAERFAKLERDVREASKLAGDIVSRVSGENWDRAAFRRSSAFQSLALKPASEHGLAIASAWLREAGSADYAALTRTWLDEWRARTEVELANIRAGLDAARADERRAKRFERDPASVLVEIDRVQSDIAALSGVFVSARSEPELRKTAADIGARILGLAAAIPRESEFETIEALLGHVATIRFGSEAIEARWHSLIAELSAGAGAGDVVTAERRLLHEWEPKLREVVAMFSPDVPSIPFIERETLDRVLAVRRERDLSTVARLVSIESGADQRAISAMAAAYERWADEVLRACQEAGRAGTMLSQGYRLDEPDAEGVTIRGLLGPSLRQPLAVVVTPAIRPITSRVAELEALTVQEDVDALLDAAERSGSSELSLAIEAVDRLSRLDAWSFWRGESLGRLERVARLAEGFSFRFDGAELPVGRRVVLAERVGDATARVWRSSVMAACGIAAESDRASSLDAVFSLAEAVGVKGGVLLDGRAAYNWELWSLRQRLGTMAEGSSSPENSSVARALESLLSVARPLVDDAEVRPVLRRLERAVNARAVAEFSSDDAGPRAWDAPLREKWSVRESGGTLTYLWAGPTATHAIDFRLVSAPGLAPVYVATRELSLGLFLDALTESGRAGELVARTSSRGAMLEIPAVERREVVDSRRGPRVWTSELRSDARAPIRSTLGGGPDSMWGWYTTNETLIGFRGSSARQSYLPELGTLPTEQLPTPEKPLQYVSPEAAVLVARVLGCRLPTSAEWLAALEAAGGVGAASRGANLRDKTWQSAFEQIELTKRTHRGRYTLEPEMPNGGIFWPAGSRENVNDDPPGWDRSPATTSDDGVLFFRDAARGPTPDREVHELIGNVAEMLWESPETIERLPYTATAFEVFEAIPQDYGPLRIIGASALSPAGWGEGRGYRPDVPYSPESPARAKRGYSDVGVRLVMPTVGPADTSTPRQRALRALHQAKYLRVTAE